LFAAKERVRQPAGGWNVNDDGRAMNDSDEKIVSGPVGRLRAPIGGQEIELLQIDYVHGGMSLLRVRIREGNRFTVFDIDPVTAKAWGEMMRNWAAPQLARQP
jgi:hypothetical protein